MKCEAITADNVNMVRITKRTPGEIRALLVRKRFPMLSGFVLFDDNSRTPIGCYWIHKTPIDSAIGDMQYYLNDTRRGEAVGFMMKHAKKVTKNRHLSVQPTSVDVRDSNEFLQVKELISSL